MTIGRLFGRFGRAHFFAVVCTDIVISDFFCFFFGNFVGRELLPARMRLM